MQDKSKVSRRGFIKKSAGASAALVIPGFFTGYSSGKSRSFNAEEYTTGNDQNIRAGFAELDISPDIGMEQPGGYGKVYHKSFHDPCKVRAAVFDDGVKRVALVCIDALIVRRSLVQSVRKQIQARCGIPSDAILIGASHSHSSGPTGMILPGEYDHADPFVRSLAYDKSSCADPKYLALVEKQLTEVVCQADKALEVQLGVGKGFEDKVAFNRRFRMKNGLSFTHPGQLNPDIIEPAGPS